MSKTMEEEKNPTVLKIVELWLKEYGFDGLLGGECGCTLGDLAPCDFEYAKDCRAAYKQPCNRMECTEHCVSPGEVVDSCMQLQKFGCK